MMELVLKMSENAAPESSLAIMTALCYPKESGKQL
jgi:hypothetical protein